MLEARRDKRASTPLPFVSTALATLALAACATPRGPAVPPAIAAPAAEQAVLPARYCGGYFIVEARINDTGPYPLIVDSGAARTSLTPEVYESARVRGRIDELVIGPLTARRVRVQENEVAHIADALGTDVAGILGHPTFRGALISYDYPRRQLRVRRGSLPREGPGIVPTSDGERPFVRAFVGEREVTMLVDTGASRGLSLTELAGHGRAGPVVPVGMRGRIDGFSASSAARLTDDVRIGPLTIAAPVVADSVSVDLIGQDILRHFVVTFDQEGGRMLLERPDAPLDAPLALPEPHGFGAGVIPRGDGLEIVRVFDGTPAVSADLRVGDRIVAVDDRPLAALGCLAFRSGWESPGVSRLRIERDGETIDLDVPIVPLVQ